MMKIDNLPFKVIAFLILGLLWSIPPCKAQRVNSGAYNVMLQSILKEDVPTVSVAQADSLKKADGKVVFLDTREKKEYEVSHIEDAVWVGYDDFKMGRMKGVSKDAKIVTYCSVGARSENIAQKLIEAGYTDVNNMYGSIFEWVNQSKPVVNNAGDTTQKVHTYNKKWGFWLKKGEKVYE